MNFEKSYMIIQPIKLPWMYVSPNENQGLEYHLSPDVSIELNGIVSGDIIFKAGNVLLSIMGEEVNEIQAENMFLTEILPAKSQERIAKSFKDGDTSCFFTVKEMEYMTKLFDEKNFMCHSVTINYKGMTVDDIPSLPPQEFNLVVDAFSDMNVLGSFDYRDTKEELQERYDVEYKNKIAELEKEKSETLWDKVKQKGVKRNLARSIGLVVVGMLSFAGRVHLNNKGSMRLSLLGAFIGVVGVAAEMLGRNGLESQINSFGVSERVVFGR